MSVEDDVRAIDAQLSLLQALLWELLDVAPDRNGIILRFAAVARGFAERYPPDDERRVELLARLEVLLTALRRSRFEEPPPGDG